MQKISIRNVCFVALALLGLAILTPFVQAQSAFGTIVGTVTDASGAAVPGATANLTNIGTNEKKTVQTDAAGNYRFMSLLPAQYKLELEKTGYKRVSQSPVTVLIDASTRVDVALEVGAASETVEVTTQAPLLQTESGSLGGQVEGKTVQEMPLNGRNVTNLIALVPGVVPQGSSTGNATMNQGTHTNNAGWGNFQIGGSLAGQGAFFVDGAPLIGLGGNFVSYVPFQDSIQEFKVGTNAVSAEFGRLGGGVVEMTTKSATNQIHGSTYEYFRNRSLNANDWFSKQSQLAKGQANKPAQWNQNQYGVTVGGPIIKDKLFLFFGFENFASRTGTVTNTNVPTTGMMAANAVFSGKLTVPAGLTVFGTAFDAAKCLVYDASANTTTIPAACIDPTSNVLKNYFPAPNTSTAIGSGNFVAVSPLGSDSTQFNTRVDYNPSGNQRLFARYMKLNTNDKPNNPFAWANGFKTSGAISIYPTQQGIIGDTITINPTTILDLRLSYLRQYFDDLPAHVGTDLSKVGTAGQSLGANWVALNKLQTVPELPQLSFSGKYSFYAFNGWVTQQNWLDTYALSGSLIKIMGNHTIKYGGEIRQMKRYSLPQFNPGQISMSTQYTGDEFANFLLGMPTSVAFMPTQRVTTVNRYQGYYATDTWNVNRKLTITAGLRWELPGTLAESQGRAVVALPNQDAVVNGVNTHGILSLVNTSVWRNKASEPAQYSLLSPRIGVAYRLTDKTVLRGGFALFYLPPDIALGLLPGNSAVNAATTRVDNGGTAVTGTVNNPFGAGVTGYAQTVNTPVGKTNPNWLAAYANKFNATGKATGNVSAPVPTNDFSYMSQWNFGIGQSFKWEQSLEVGYAGALGIHLSAVGQAGWNLNMISPTTAAALAAGTMTTAQAQASRPRPAYNNFIDLNPLNGTMTYHSLQVRYQKRFGAGILSSGYTWSKSIGDTDTVSAFLDNGRIGSIQNYNNIKEERSLLSFSIDHRSVTSYVIDLPFGKGKKWANNLGGGMDRIVGGWAVNGITTLQTGQPATIAQGNNQLASWGGGTSRPNVVAGCDKSVSGSAYQKVQNKKWFNTACYTPVATSGYALGNQPRVDTKVKQQAMVNFDFSAVKKTTITEGKVLQFRIEFFNVFNHVQFAMPNLTATAGAFGQVTAMGNKPRQIQASMRFDF